MGAWTISVSDKAKLYKACAEHIRPIACSLISPDTVGYATLIVGVADAQLARQTPLPMPSPARLAAPPPPVAPVVINGDGGLVHEYRAKYLLVRNSGAKVEVRGACYSACTLITAYIPKERLCFGEGAFLAFHSAIMASTAASRRCTPRC